MARPITLFTGQWADLPFEEVARLASEWGYDGLELACWGDHLDPWRWDDDEYVQGAARPARAPRPEGVGDLEPPEGPGGVRRPDRRAAPRHPVGPGLGRRRPRGRAAARGRGDAAHGAPRREARREDRRGLHRVERSGSTSRCSRPPRRSSSTRATRTSPTGGTRSSTCSTRSACDSRTRCTRRRSPTTTGRPCARSRRSATARRSASTGTRRTSCGRTSTRSSFILDFADRIYHVDCKDVKLDRRQRPQRPARLAPRVGRPAPRMGLRLDRARRRAVGEELPRAQRDRLRRADLGRVGGRRDGSPRRRARGARVREAQRVRGAGGGVRRGVQHALEPAPPRLRPAEPV